MSLLTVCDICNRIVDRSEIVAQIRNVEITDAKLETYTNKNNSKDVCKDCYDKIINLSIK